MARVDAIVLGAGIVGTSIALHLAKRGLSVALVDRKGTIVVETSHDPANSLVRVTVADDGPGIPAGEREKLFMPYYSTKGRGSGHGLAIVRRIVAEHGGSIEVADNMPRGTRFTIELPA